MGVYIPNMKMPEKCGECRFAVDGWCYAYGKPNIDALANDGRTNFCPLVPVPTHGRLRRRIVYRGEVYNALESARINALDGILTDRYKDGFHDGLKKALEILANEVQDAPTIIPAEEDET